MENKLNKLAVASFLLPFIVAATYLIFVFLNFMFEDIVLSLFFFLMPIYVIIAFLNIILGIVAFRKIKRNNERGLWYVFLGWFITISLFIYLVFVVVALSSIGHM